MPFLMEKTDFQVKVMWVAKSKNDVKRENCQKRSRASSRSIFGTTELHSILLLILDDYRSIMFQRKYSSLLFSNQTQLWGWRTSICQRYLFCPVCTVLIVIAIFFKV